MMSDAWVAIPHVRQSSVGPDHFSLVRTSAITHLCEVRPVPKALDQTIVTKVYGHGVSVVTDCDAQELLNIIKEAEMAEDA